MASPSLRACSFVALAAAHSPLGCADPAMDAPAVPASLSVEGLPEAPQAGGREVPGLAVVARDGHGAPLAGVDVAVTVTAGGGSAAVKSVTTDAEGRAAIPWTLGPMPVRQGLNLAAEPAPAVLAELDVDTAADLAPEPFGDLDAVALAHGLEGSTEDLAFGPDGRLVMGVPGGLVAVDADGRASVVETHGDPLVKPLGLAYDARGDLWIADVDAEALVRVEPDGRATTIATDDGEAPFAGPNDVAVGRDRVYVSDPCAGRVSAFDLDGNPVGRVSFPPATGGPNGLVVGPDGALWATTGNTVLFCPRPGVGLTDPVAALYWVPRGTADGAELGTPEPIATQVATFGDGLAFDAEGNLFALFDRATEAPSVTSIVFVLPRGGTELRPALTARGRVWANLAFGQGAFGAHTLYLALLQVPLLTEPELRGAERVELGLAGAPLPPMQSDPERR